MKTFFNEEEVTAFMIKSDFLEKHISSDYTIITAENVKNDELVPIAVKTKDIDMLMFFRELFSFSKYIKETKDYGSEFWCSGYFPFKGFLDNGIDMLYVHDSDTGWSCDELTQNNSEIENLFGSLDFMQLASLDIKDCISREVSKDPIKKSLIEIIKEMFTSMPEYQFISPKYHDEVASALATYLIFLANEGSNTFLSLFEGDSNVRFRIDGRVRIYYPIYGGTKDWENVESNKNGAFETANFWRRFYDYEFKYLVKTITRFCRCNSKSKLLFNKLLNTLFQETNIGGSEIFGGVLAHMWDRKMQDSSKVLLVDDGRGTFEFRKVEAKTDSSSLFLLEFKDNNEYAQFNQCKYNCIKIYQRLKDEFQKA